MIIKPNIDIKQYCIFCHKTTDNVASYTYYDPLGKGYDHIFIRFPAHPNCFFYRKVFRFTGLLIGIFVFFLTAFLGSWVFDLPKSMNEWPFWLWTGSIIFAAIFGLFCFFKIHFKTVEIIHEYYVLNEKLPEADKSWRRRRSRI